MASARRSVPRCSCSPTATSRTSATATDSFTYTVTSGGVTETATITINVADETSVAQAIEFTVKRFGRIDAIVNAAGVIKRQPSLEMPVAEFRRIVDVNLTGSFICAQEAIRIMKAQSPKGGRISSTC